MSLLDELKKREIINNITNETKATKFFKDKNNGVYVGFDPSFHSLHLGNLIMVILLRRFNDAGFKTYAVLGGATGMIGDPSGKNSERQLLSLEKLQFNKDSIGKQLIAFTKSKVVDNYDFYKDFHILDFLRDVGKKININTMLERDIIKNRLEIGISFTEFTYSILQGYDFYYLWRNENVNLQMGGSDQWSNITAGIDLIKKEDLNNNAFGMTINLLTKKDGSKFGKSEEGAIYLDSQITSPYVMYQFFYNQADDDLEKMYHFFSFKSLAEIKKILKDHFANPKLRLAQKLLSEEIVTFIHGESSVQQIIKINEIIFSKAFEKLTKADFEMIAIDNITTLMKDDEINIIDLLVITQLAESKSKARQLLSQKSIKVNNHDIMDQNVIISKKDAYLEKYSVIQKGKKDFKIIKWAN
ncbi:MAG: tyrosine--tRNA ligase [Mycoplasmoidaceae bacterium]